MVPWDSRWNAIVLRETENVEKVETIEPEPPTPAPGASPSPFDPPTSPNQRMPASSPWKPKSILPRHTGSYQTIRWTSKTSAWTETPYLEYSLNVHVYTGQAQAPWLLPDGHGLVVDENFSHWLDSEAIIAGPRSGTVIP